MILGSESVTANGSVIIPEGCVYVVAFCVGSVDPPYLNGNQMQTKASVAAQGILRSISIHVSAFPTVATLPFVMNGADNITFVYLDDAVCTRGDVVQGYSESTGNVTGNLPTSTNDIAFGMVLGSNGQVEIKGDTVALTLLDDQLTLRVGYIVPGDTVLTCLASDASTLSGYWYTPPPIWHDTTTTILVEAGHYEFNPVYHNYWWVNVGGNYWDEYQYNAPGDPEYIEGTHLIQDNVYSSQTPSNGSFYTYPGVWVPDRYETVPSGYWEYPPQVWIVTGVAGQVSAAFISVADVMIGGTYVGRPLVY